MLCFLKTVSNQPESGLTHSPNMFQCSARSILDIMEMLGSDPPPENESPSTASGTAATVSSKKKHCCSVCDGKGHVQPGKKRHFSEKYCPIAAKQAKT